MKMNEMFPSNYLKGDEIRGKRLLVIIKSGQLEEMQDGGQKPVLYFERASKGLVLNKTNGDTLAEAYGDDSDAWIGKPVILYFDPKVSYAGKRTGGIRMEIPQEQDGRGRKRQPPVEEPPEEDEAPLPEDSDGIPF